MGHISSYYSFLNAGMGSTKGGSTPIALVCTATLTVGFYLISSMVLLSTIITWISVAFSGPLPHLLGFALGLLSLIDAIALLLLIGVKNLRQTLGFISLIVTVVTLLVSIALLIPFLISFANFCEDCTQEEQTIDCVDSCNDECCFRDMSRPILIVFLAFSALALFSSILGVLVSASYLCTGHRKQY